MFSRFFITFALLSLTLSLLPSLASKKNPSSSASPTKPVWPTQFTASFGLWDFLPATPIFNASAEFLYSFDYNGFQASLIDYPERCINIYPFNDLFGCQLFFVNNNTYLSSPGFAEYSNTPEYSCCLVIPGVGPVPPTFLQGFNYSTSNSLSPKQITAPDYFGNIHNVEFWEGSGFSYWTDSTTGHDIFFNDGSSGIYWAWNPNFNVAPQPQSEFNLPGNQQQCNTMCPLFKPPMGAENMKIASPMEMALRDPFIHMAAKHHGVV